MPSKKPKTNKVDRDRRLRGNRYKKKSEPPAPIGECPTPHKVKHANRSQAKIAMRQQERAKGKKLRTYKCPGCGCWHVGTPHFQSRAESRAVAGRKAQKKPPAEAGG